MCAIFIFTAAVALSTLLAIKLMDVHEASITESEGRSLAATTSLVTVDCSGKTPSGEMVDGVMILVIGLFVGVGVEMISMLVVPMMVTDRIAIHSDMLRERQRAFVMLILGESVIQLALPNVSGLAFEHESAALSGFTLVFSMALMYFDVKQVSLCRGTFHIHLTNVVRRSNKGISMKKMKSICFSANRKRLLRLFCGFYTTYSLRFLFSVSVSAVSWFCHC